MSDVVEHTAVGFCADFNKSPVPPIRRAGQFDRRRDHELAEEWSEVDRGVEVGVRRQSGPAPIAAVVADRRVVERQLHETGEAQGSARTNGGEYTREVAGIGGGRNHWTRPRFLAECRACSNGFCRTSFGR